ncbi:4Fe-4S dicluster domain-containing protein [Treponema sp. TIM-1]|uniref:[Fe-Fe] hydrogenase large subunit C-terminal domain-containing protein n=1 Tax=Treponema sp. TIM-1 TaxID=2898417 RepID=UPI0039806567
MTEYITLKTSDCKNCYKCIRHCPVKSIRFADNQAHIVADDCISCGNCFVTCPQQAKEIRDDLGAAQALIENGGPVYASLAPSFTANYGGRNLDAMERALKKLGFTGVEETAIGATMVKRQYDALLKNETHEVIISSCCHSVNLLIQKYYPGALPFLAPVLSPMLAHSMDLKRRYPEAKTIFIGPCISKKSEAEMYTGFVDQVLTFRELSRWLEQKNISLDEAAGETENREPKTGEAPGRGLARLFPTAGGILRTMAKENPRYAYLSVDGIDNCIRAIEDLIREKPKKCFIEMSACAGSCVGGPVMERKEYSPVRDYINVLRYAGKNDFETQTYSSQTLDKKFVSLSPRRIHLGAGAIEEVLRKLGKTKPEHELNCGSCGYNTCREKALAVLEGKATLTMCLPYLKERAESFSENIITNTPNGIVVLNEVLEVQQINAAACRLLNISPPDILGDQVVRVLDPMPFIEVCRQEKNIYNQRVYLADYKKYIDQTIIYDKSYHIIIGIMRDVTDEAARKAAKEEFNRKTMEIADRVIEKQMRTVQEIASLLGETTAETRVALTKLKEGLTGE